MFGLNIYLVIIWFCCQNFVVFTSAESEEKDHRVINFIGVSTDDNNLKANGTGTGIGTTLVACFLSKEEGKEFYTNDRLFDDIRHDICKMIDVSFMTTNLIKAHTPLNNKVLDEIAIVVLQPKSDDSVNWEIVSENRLNQLTPATNQQHFGSIKYDFNTSISCEVNYYGDNCTKYCVPNPSTSQTCDSNGKLVCGELCLNQSHAWMKKVYKATFLLIAGQCLNDHNDSVCQNGGVCTMNGEDASCECPEQYSGNVCEYLFCDHIDCGNHGKCNYTDKEHPCQCEPFYEGQHCEINMNVCDNSSYPQCENGGTCISSSSHMVCDCPYGFSGDLCEYSTCNNSSCNNHGICIPAGLDGNFTCICEDNYEGDYCEKKVPDIDDVTCNKICYNNGSCLLINHPITNKTMQQCRCSQQYTGDNCENLLSNPTSIPTTLYTSTQQTHIVTTNDMKNACQNSPCLNDAICINTAEGFFCNCSSNYEGERCENLVLNNKCEENKTICQNGGICNITSDGQTICICSSGFTGKLCSITHCGNGDCYGNGSCNQIDDEIYKCDCKTGFSGDFCDELSTFNACRELGYLQEFCENNGTCEPNPDDLFHPLCNCQPGYHGANCEFELDWCEVNQSICGSHGTCVSVANHGPLCECQPGYTGKLCDISEVTVDCTSEFCQCSVEAIERAKKIGQDTVGCHHTHHTSVNGYCDKDGCLTDDCPNNKLVCKWQSPCQYLIQNKDFLHIPEECSYLQIQVDSSKLYRKMTTNEFCKILKKEFEVGDENSLTLCNISTKEGDTTQIDVFIFSQNDTLKLEEYTKFVQIMQHQNKKISGISRAINQVELMKFDERNVEVPPTGLRSLSPHKIGGIVMAIVFVSTLLLSVICYLIKRNSQYKRFGLVRSKYFSQKDNRHTTEEFTGVRFERQERERFDEF